jgi:lipopolysaccharide biosynthesis regulator YciM
MYFSLFFIPIIHWGRRYYMKSTCCQTVYEIDKDLGKRLHKGEEVILSQEDIQEVTLQHGHAPHNRCTSCGYLADSQFDYCPKCGTKL